MVLVDRIELPLTAYKAVGLPLT